MDPVEPHIHSFIVKVWQEVVVGNGDEQGWRGYITHVPSGTRRYFEDLAEILAFIEPTLVPEAATRAGSHDVAPPAMTLTDEVERTATHWVDAVPGPEEVEMDSSPSGLEALQKQLGDGDTDVNKAEQAASGAQLILKRRRDAQAALQKTVDEAKASSAAIDKAIAASIGPAATAGRALKDMDAMLMTTLTEEQRKAVEQIVKSAADERAAVVRTREQKKTAADEAQSKAETTMAASNAASANLARAQSDFKELGTAIQSLTARVTTLSNGAKAALDAKRPGAAFRLNRQLKDALDQLAAKVDAKGTDALEGPLGDAWKVVAKAREDAIAASDELAKAKSDLHAAGDKLKAFDAKAEASVDEQIASLEQQWTAGASTAPTSNGGDTTGAGSKGTASPQAAESGGTHSEAKTGGEPDQSYGEATA